MLHSRLVFAWMILALPSLALAGENWIQVGSHKFGFWDSLERGQGLTNDGHGHFWYSASENLIRTSSEFTSINDAEKSEPFPMELKYLRDDHIGDIDYWDGKIYIGIEDGSKYQHPYVGIYDAETLENDSYKSLPLAWQPDGVPWVAVDAKRNYLISAQYNRTTRINVYDLNTIEPVMQIPLSRMMDSIQGGKVLEDSLYISANDVDVGTGFAIYKIALASGQVEKVAKLDSSIHEVEGLTFTPEGADYRLHVLGVNGKGLKTRMVLFDFLR